ncbi:HepT-like ribonuclease domain-containing protein [Mariniflexile maritimum]|uniref:HepT-like ribonuclease domain-containing protein n=1 Tax=Mariniflexile maritimum TaxID=2682493 RepID=UPI0012F6DB70|nr:HepT-like ribonuclease domain-containing protein [Mariniflexile maritimum]
MDNDVKTFLYDILQSINEIDSYYGKKPRIFKEYISDTKTKRAIERNLEIIGEAANRILKKDKDFKLDNVDKIIGTRNRIIHGYDKISDDLIWSIVINHLPRLKDEVTRLLDE